MIYIANINISGSAQYVNAYMIYNRTLRNDVGRIVDLTNIQDQVPRLLFSNKATVCLLQHHPFKGYNAFSTKGSLFSGDIGK